MKTKRAISIILAVFMLLTPMFTLSVQAAESGDSVAPVSSMKAYQDFLDELMIEYNISGVAYVTQDGRVLCQSARGMHNPEENKEMSIGTLFPVGSISKQFCATSILLLQEQGKLSVDDKLSKYFPEYTIGKDVTIKNLLNMRSGIRDHINKDNQYKGHEYPTDWYTVTTTATQEENQKSILNWLFTQELKFAPDKMFSYSNSNFLLLSIIVEQVSGMDYYEFIKQNVFKPLGMTNSGFYEELVNDPNLAAPYIHDGVLLLDPNLHGISQGAGDIVSNAKDMDIWMTSLAEGTLLSDESFKEMSTPVDIYGYGIFYDDTVDGLYHTGGYYPYVSVMYTFPDKNLNIFVVTSNVDELEYDILYAAQDILVEVNSDVKLGDVDGDSDVSILDATAIQLHVAQLQPISDDLAMYGDTDNDGDISVMDATAIQLFIAGL